MSEGFKYTGPGYYRTRDGRKALAAEHNGTLSGQVLTFGGSWYMTCWWMNGKHAEDPLPSDLVGPWREPRKISGWVNVYDHGHDLYSTRSEADRDQRGWRGAERVACIYVTGTEGIEPEGDNA